MAASPRPITPSRLSAVDQLNGVGDIPLTVQASFGQSAITLRKLLELNAGDTLTLSKAVGEGLDLYVGDLLIGSAAILVMDGLVTIQITDIFEKPGASKGLEA